MGESLKDPVCGMVVRADSDLTASWGGAIFRFCSEFCRKAFLQDPARYAASPGEQASSPDEPVRRVAYFSMEVGVDPRMPTYSGGLGILAGDTLKSAADLKLPLVAVSLLNAHGYVEQKLDAWGNQQEYPAAWEPAHFARPLAARAQVSIEGRPVVVRAWQYDVTGLTGFRVPLFLLDTDLPENTSADRGLTAWLYGGDDRYRLCQEVVLGIGGVRLLRTLGYTRLERFHMNEGHAALLTLELLREKSSRGPAEWDFHGVREQCLFTTHTPVPAGHDQFSYDLVRQVLGEPVPGEVLGMLGGADRLNMTRLGLDLSGRLNGVARRHAEVSQGMFPGYPIDSITNGVHSRTWTSASFRELFDRHIPGWVNDPSSLRHAINIPRAEVWDAHVRAKEGLLKEVERRTQAALDRDALTIGFARRATPYKRADLVLHDVEQLAQSAATARPIQFVFAGKAHPRDQGGKDVIRRVFDAARRLGDRVRVVYLENYDMELGLALTSGVDVWLNTPLRPLEASGTSGMKAAHNGVPSFSVLDGWWVEGHIEGVTGWSIGSVSGIPASDAPDEEDARELYHKLRTVIVPLFYHDRERWIDIMRQTIAFNASFFNTHRMVQQYAANAYV
jgi:starch phosphorylase